MPDDSYKRMLDRADTWFAKVMREQPRNLQCGRGCSLCCHGLFEIGSGDIPLLAEGLATAHPAPPKTVVPRAGPNLGNSPHPHPPDRPRSPDESSFYATLTTSV